MKYIFISLLIFLTGCIKSSDDTKLIRPLIPKPSEITIDRGKLLQIDELKIFAHADFDMEAVFLKEYLENGSGLMVVESPMHEATIQLIKSDTLPNEAYVLVIRNNKVLIEATDPAGIFYGIQTFRQLLPVAFEKQNGFQGKKIVLPSVSIFDAPKFPYRGMHLDVARHFFPKEFIKKYISNLAFLKMNYFHWHLTEDQGWRIEIKKYPKLTSHAAYREETLIGHYNEIPQIFDGVRYGGFYTQEDIKEIVAFANKHHVTIIPEIEMPGHSQAAISAYPELGCTKEQVPVATKWGVFENIYCPNETTFMFLKDVLTEVMDLFPGEYVHIGGDEAPKLKWKQCPHCQGLIKKLNLQDEQELQSYFIREIESFVNSKGKKIIGWDEILEGGLAPNATVMSWRGTIGGIEAAKENHHVIMTPNSHAYFDYYQSDNPEEPLAIGGYIPLEKVYAFDPVPDELTDEQSKYILGAQGNLWTEYIKTTEKVEYMVFPRILALSEVVWSGPSNDLESEYPNFLERVEPFFERLDAMSINHANHLYEIEGDVIKRGDEVYYALRTPTAGKEIMYSIHDGEQVKYSKPVRIDTSCRIMARVYKKGVAVGREFSENIHYHKGIFGSISLNVEPHPAYSTGGIEALNNGIFGSDKRYGDNEWLGFWGNDLEININFEKEIEVSRVSLRFYNANGQWIYAPKQISVKTEPINGKSTSFERELDIEEGESLVKIDLPFDSIKTKGLVITIPNFGTIPQGNQGAGNKAWTFIDEIVIE